MSKRANQEVEFDRQNNDSSKIIQKKKRKRQSKGKGISFNIKKKYFKNCKTIYISLMKIPLMEVEIAKIIAQLGCSSRERCCHCQASILPDLHE